LVKDGAAMRSPVERICSFDDAVKFFSDLVALPHEEMHIVYMTAANIIRGRSMISRGGLHGAAMTPSDVYRGALIAGARGIVLAHNHPSGDPTPSEEDVAMTLKLREIGAVLGVVLIDHIVVARNGASSLNGVIGS
jgi:DNA repair protein RadC